MPDKKECVKPTSEVGDLLQYKSESLSEIEAPRIILVDGSIKDKASSVILAGLLELQTLDPVKDITLVINSPGGHVTELLAIIDIMDIITCDIKTIVLGEACSAAAVIALCGKKGKRFATENSRIMLHRISGGAIGNINDVKVDIAEMRRLDNKIVEIIAAKTKMGVATVNKMLERDCYLTPKEAIKLGIIDSICTSIN